MPATRPSGPDASGEADATASCLACWADALRAATLLAVDPHGLGGAILTAGHGPVRDGWLAALRASLPAASPIRRVPLPPRDDRLRPGSRIPSQGRRPPAAGTGPPGGDRGRG